MQAKVEQNLDAVGRKVDEVGEIADIMGRTDGSRKVGGGEELTALREAYAQLQQEKERAADYFARKRVEDIRDLEDNVSKFEGDLEELRASFSSHGPFTLSWKSHEALADLDVVLGKTADLGAREKAILEAAAALDFERAPSSGLVQFEKRVRTVYVIWEVEGEWEHFQKNLLSSPALQSCSDKACGADESEPPAADTEAAIKETLATLSNKIGKVSSAAAAAAVEEGEGESRLEELDIFLFLKSNVEAYRRAMGLIGRLKSPSLRPRHWREISRLCGFTPDPTSLLQNRTYDEVAAIFLEKDDGPIAAVIETAIDESKIEEQLAGERKVQSCTGEEGELFDYDL